MATRGSNNFDGKNIYNLRQDYAKDLSIQVLKDFFTGEYELRHEKTCFLHMQKQRGSSAPNNHAQLISAFAFAT